ncbi:MAG TPA: DNA gyrase subunit A [bacterium]|nr:DNA gyrase subunit A [bacterium]
MSDTEIVNNSKIIPTPITSKMQEAYLDYAMSVIVARALPDVRDGLKPVHRRILYAMQDMGLTSKAKYQKCAKVVGEVMGKYHPHGDQAIYDTLVRLAQDFNMRYMLVDGQGNFGSIDGDNAAAMRYTECRMAAIASELLEDIRKDTVNFTENYDGSHQEPVVLPSRLPNLLLQGSSGIAVGMATNIPPHNLNEVVDAIAYLVDNPEARIEELVEFIQGPDFPTGGYIFNKRDILNAYINGRGSVTMRAKNDFEELKGGRNAIIVTEIPYQVNKASLILKIAELVKDKKITGISALRDESDKRGMRIVIELKRDAIPKVILNQLYKHTQMQLNFNFNMVALVDGKQPKVLHLRKMLQYFIDHRFEVITRRTQFELKEAQARAHILEGLKIALDNLDAVIKTIRSSKTVEEARTNLMTKYSLSRLQADAILEMQLRRLAALERQKIEDEYTEILKLIAELTGILASDKKIRSIIKKELVDISKKYGDERRTKIVPSAVGDFNDEDLIKEEDVYITISRDGYIKRMTLDTYRSQHRGGKGVMGMNTKEEDTVEHLIISSTHHNLLFFTNKGRVFRIKAYEVPEAGRTARGRAIINLLQIEQEETIQGVLSIEGFNQPASLLFATRQGIIKKTALADYENIRSTGIIAINLREGDELAGVKLLENGNKHIIMISEHGQSIRFNADDVRDVGRNSIGVIGIRLHKDDRVIDMDIIEADADSRQKVCVLSENGYGKCTLIKYYPLQGRGGKGVKTAQLTDKTGKLRASKIVDESVEDLVVISEQAQVIRLPLKNVSTLGRATQGVRVMRLNSGDRVAEMTAIAEED